MGQKIYYEIERVTRDTATASVLLSDAELNALSHTQVEDIALDNIVQWMDAKTEYSFKIMKREPVSDDIMVGSHMGDPRYCSVCEQCNDNPDIHRQTCPGKLVVRVGRSYKQWYTEMNAVVLKLAKVSADDLADSDYWDSWDAGLSPTAMAYKVLEENGFPFEEG